MSERDTQAVKNSFGRTMSTENLALAPTHEHDPPPLSIDTGPLLHCLSKRPQISSEVQARGTSTPYSSQGQLFSKLHGFEKVHVKRIHKNHVKRQNENSYSVS